MSWLETVTDEWGGRAAVVRLVLRLLGLTVFLYFLALQGTFSQTLWVALVAGAAFALAYAVMFLRTLRPQSRLIVVLVAVMMACSAVVNPQIAYTGGIFFVVGGVVLLGQPEIPLRVSVPVVVAMSVVLLLATAVERPSLPPLLSSLFAVAVVALMGAVRRQRTIREQREKELAARSRELEERNAELVAQTARTRQEAARVAALTERGRIARDLHDLLAHSLGGLVVQLEAASAELEGGHTEQAAVRLRSSRQLAVDGLREARAAVQELRSDDTEAAGQEPIDLVTALGPVLRGPVGLHLGAELEVAGEPRPVPGAVAEVFTAVCREGLTNINKHAPTSTVSLTLVFGPDRLRLEVVNGLPERSDQPAPTTGPGSDDLATSGLRAGLAGLRERLATVGGTLVAGPEGRRWVLAAETPMGES